MSQSIEKRKLAAVLAVDVVGYSGAAERDEQGALRAVAALRARLYPVVEAHGGRVFSTAGDGFMSEFPLPSAAVRAAVELLEAAVAAESGLPKIRAGAHLGEVNVEGEDLLGHGVNVAARLMQMATPNSLVVSETVRTPLRRPGVQFTPLGTVSLAKMQETVQAFAFAPAGVALPVPRRAQRRLPVIAAAGAAVVVLAGAGGVLMLQRQPDSYDIQGIELIARSERAEGFPTVSPDGRYLLYVAEDVATHSGDLYMRDFEGGEEVRLTQTPEFEAGPAFSPSGTQLAFARNANPNLSSAQRRPCEIFIRAFPDGLDRRVGSCSFDPFVERLSWTADGRSLIFNDRESAEDPIGRIRILDIGSGVVRDLVEPLSVGLGDFEPSVSPDGSRLAFVRYRAPEIAEVLVFHMRTRRLVSVTDDVKFAHIAWTPDSRALFVSTGRELWVWPADGSGAGRRILVGMRDILRPVAAPGMLVFHSSTTPTNLFRLRRGGGPEALTHGFQYDHSPAFSITGRLAYVSDQDEFWIYLQTPGEPPRRLTRVDADEPRGLRWSPDGRRLVLVATHDGSAKMFVVDAESGRIDEAEVDFDGVIGNASWSADGRALLFAGTTEDGVRLYRSPLHANAPPEPISPLGWVDAIETNGGLFAANIARAGVWLLGAERDEQLIFPEARRETWPSSGYIAQLDWTASGGELYAIEGDTVSMRVLARRNAQGAPRVVAELGATIAYEIAVDPVSGDIVYSATLEDSWDVGVIRFRAR
jgi:class 3 adenylate cyclase/Tol biopolymer transport system component